MTLRNRYIGLCWLAAALLLIFIRLYQLDRIPPGLFIDEVSYGYNAYSLLTTGQDEFGEPYPLYFKATGEYKNPLTIYAAIPLFAVFGADIWSLRLVSVIFSLLGCGAIAYWCWLARKQAWFTLGAFCLAGVLPWLFPYSRLAFDAITLPFFVGLGLLLFTWARTGWIQRDSLSPWQWGWLPDLPTAGFLLTGLVWGLAFYGYSTARLIAPLWIGVLALIGKPPQATWRGWLGAIFWMLAGFGLMLIPSLRYLLSHGSQGWFNAHVLRTGWMPALYPPGEVPFRVAEKWVSYFSPEFLFFAGDANLRHHSGLGGEIFVSLAIPLVLGIFAAWKHRQGFFEQVLLIGFATFPAAAALTDSPYHATRAIHGAVFSIPLILLGLESLWHWLQRFRHVNVIGGVCLLAIAWEATRYLEDYFVAYPERAAPAFGTGHTEAIQTALRAKTQTGQPLYYAGTYTDYPLYIGFLGKISRVAQDPGVLTRRQIIALPPQTDLTRLPEGSVLIGPPLQQPGIAPPGWRILSQQALVTPTGQGIIGTTVFQNAIKTPPAGRQRR